MTASNSLKPIVQGIIHKLADKILIGLTIIAVLILIWGGFHFLPSAVSKFTTDQVKDIIISGVHAQSEFNTASTDSKATVVIKQDKKIFGLSIGDTNFVYEGVGTIHAGIDLKKLQVLKLDNTQHFIHISLPSPYISEVNLNVNRSSILANYRNWFGDKADTELYNQAQNKAIATIKKEACANHILEAANNNAEVLINNILSKVGFKTIQIDTQAPQSNACSVA